MEELKVGYGRVNITPDYPVAIAGSAATKISEGYLDPIYMTSIALQQGEETILLATIDFVCAYAEFAEPARSMISEATGIPEDHIILNTTHTHSSVNIRNINATGIEQYRKEFYDYAVSSAREALSDLSPAQVWYGSTMTEGMVWVRHFKMADGTYAGANYGSFKKSTIVGHASDPDPEMQVIKFARAAASKKDIVLMNLPSHATLQRELYLSADFPGPAREYVAEKTGALVAYFIAGGGDQVPSSRIPDEQFSDDYRAYGEEIGRIAVECMKNLTKLETSALSFSQRTFVGNSNKEGLERANDALAVSAVWEQVGGRGTPEGKAAAKARGFASVYAVTAILNRMKFDESRSMQLKVLSIGEISILFAPYEMFGSNAMQIKQSSPYPMTFIISCSQNHDGYLPSALGWEIGCYEAQITRYARGTAEQLVEEYVNMLSEIKSR